jgi:nucleotide-binding universal stress UspA family protein
VTASASASGATPGVPLLFERVLVSIDETPESLVAAAQARKLCAPNGRLELLAVAETYLAAHSGLAARTAENDIVAGTSMMLDRARELVEPDEVHLVSGRLTTRLCAESDRTGATLVAVGARPHRRLAALTFGGHDIEALHAVPCSVLIARPGWGPSTPRRVIVGVDGSPDGRTAELAARSLAGRLGCELVPVVGLSDNEIDLDLLRTEREDALLDPGDLAHAVVSASAKDALVLIGRRRAHDHRWGSSVAERVVYSARCSVLVVRHSGEDVPASQ